MQMKNARSSSPLIGMIVLATLACIAGCAQNNASHLSDADYKARFGKLGDPPPSAYSDYMKTHAPTAPPVGRPASK